MKLERRRAKYSRGPIGVPSVLLMLGWTGLWLLWSSPGRTAWPARRASGTRFYHAFGAAQDARLLTHPFWTGLPAHEDSRAPEHGVPEAAWSYQAGRPHYLGRTDRSVRDADAGTAVETGGERAAYEPRWADQPAFGREPGVEPAVLVGLSPSLERCGYDVPALTIANFDEPDRSWQVQLYVECDGAGETKSVFLEQGSGVPGIDAELVRTMYGGRASRPAEGCRGRVKISFGKE